MKISALLPAFLVFLMTSCNSAYKTLQTPDDVYYSSGSPANEDLAKEDAPVDRDMRMKCRDRRWRDLDDWGYDPYRYGYNTYYYYNPYYYSYPVFGCYTCGYYYPSFVRNSTPRMTNLGSYYNTDRKVVNVKTGAVSTVTGIDRFNNSNSNHSIFRGSRNSGASGATGGTRTYSPSAPSTGGGSTGSPVFRAPRN